MMKHLRSLLGLCISILLVAAPLCAQQRDDSLEQLREQLSKMEAIDRDPATAEEVRSLNRVFLKERRARLRLLLAKKIDALRQYQSSLGPALTPRENGLIENSVKDAERSLRELEATMKEGAAPEADSVRQPAVQPAEAETAARLTAAQGETAMAAMPVPAVRRASSDAASVAAQPDCYSDAPPILVETADSAAEIILEEEADSVDQFMPRLIFFTLADAVSRGEKGKLVNDAVIRTLRIRQFMEETARTDKQVGASARADGSTSAAEKPSFANLLAFAVEHGAIDKQVNGTSLTLSSSPYALIAAASGDTSTTYKKYDFFHRIGVSANFNIENQEDVLASARRNQLSEWSVRARLTRDRSTRSAEFETFWNDKIRAAFERVPLVLVGEFAELFRDETEKVRRRVAANFLGQSGYVQKYLDRTRAASDAPQKQAGLRQEILCRLKQDVFNNLDSFGIDAEARQRIVSRTLPALQAATASEQVALREVERKIEELNNRPLATFAYTNRRVADGSDYSVLKFLYERKTFSPMKVVANAGLSLYHHPERNLNRQSVRDFAFTLSLEGNAGKSPFVTTEFDQSQITFAFTGRYERLLENRRADGRKADLAFFQLRLEVPFLSGATLPFSVTYANANELIKEDHLRANFGFSFDADKLFLIRSFLNRFGAR